MSENCICQAACSVLGASEPEAKVSAAHAMAQAWTAGRLNLPTKIATPPGKNPGRPDKPLLVNPRDLKRRRLGTVEGRVALLHAIAHIEFNAIDLAADMVARFATDPRLEDSDRKQFIEDWVSVCDDEARHFMMVKRRLEVLGSFYGALPAHNGLWDAAISTMHDLAARLVIAPMVLEARGLDVTPKMITNLKNVNDQDSADILTVIYNEEIGHVAAGARWFSYVCVREGRDETEYFRELLAIHFVGDLKPPFNVEARDMAGLKQAFYDPKLAIN